jgi:hypothetical protein
MEIGNIPTGVDVGVADARSRLTSVRRAVARWSLICGQDAHSTLKLGLLLKYLFL